MKKTNPIKIELGKYTVLIVDDTPRNIELIAAYLKENGLKIITAYDGETGIEKAIRERPDLILLDVFMPTINGFETCRRLKMNDMTKDIPVIFITALEKVAQLKGFDAGGAIISLHRFIMKNFWRVWPHICACGN